MSNDPSVPVHHKEIEEKEDVVIRFAGDSGDGMQLTGTQFTHSTAILGNDLSTLPDFPAEIRAPAGSLAGVSSYQINFSSRDIRTPGDAPDVLVAMNPAALKTNLKDLREGGTLILNADSFTPENLKYAGYTSNPMEDGSLKKYETYDIPITLVNNKALEGSPLQKKDKERCKNFFALGLMFWLYERPMEATIQWIGEKFKAKPELAEANKMALKGGYNFGETTEIFKKHYRVPKASLAPGAYRNITGNEATAIGFIAGSRLTGKELLYASYPITPASDILHELSRHKGFGVKTCQAEDEIAAIGMAIGASFAGSIGLTGTSGPGLALKSESISLAIMMELPLVIINVQRGGPSTGLPTKTEQADLLQAIYGRHGESPLAVVAPATPGDCFTMAIESVRIAVRSMTPVIFLSDGYLANGAEPWKIPDFEKFKTIPVEHPTAETGPFLPYARDEKTLARPWALPGTPGLEHRLGGLEKQELTGNVSYDPLNHERMVKLRAEKIARIGRDIPPLEVFGKESGNVLLAGWGGTFGAITQATEQLQKEGFSISSIHLRYLNPFPPNLGEILERFETVIVPELNMGQLALLLRARYLLDVRSICKVQAQPFKVQEIVDGVKEIIKKTGVSSWSNRQAALRS
ncbi:MAG: 2-oxoacid:acceptor oxidoreductase subunit alpha [Deltaproteobacteria bacterium]|nr:2-oxoacid:acceptor oxidoreductase subunit alpha [Deltaproteobacteria bacterium]